MFILKTSICNEQNNYVYPQTLSMGPDYDWDAEDSVSNMKLNQALEQTPNFNAFNLDPDTLLTDVVSQGYVYTNGLLISPAFLEALSEYSVQPHTLYPAKVVLHDSLSNYLWMHMINDIESHIDFSRSRFERVEKGRGIREEILVDDAFHLRDLCKEFTSTMGIDLLAKELVFHDCGDLYDLFFLRLTERTIFLSDRLGACLERSELTGFDIVPADTMAR